MLSKDHPDYLKYFSIFRDIWNLFRKYYTPPKIMDGDEEYWENFIRDGGQICSRYPDDSFVMALYRCIENEFKRRYEEKNHIKP